MAEEKKANGCQQAAVVSRLETLYKEEIVPDMMKEFGYSSVMECPKLVKIVLNMRLGEYGSNQKNVEEACRDMAQISGQKPVVTRAK